MTWSPGRNSPRRSPTTPKPSDSIPTAQYDFAFRGVSWSEKGEHDKAVADLDAAIRIDPNNAQAYFNRWHTWAEKKEYDKAIADLDAAIRIDPAQGQRP